jgi:toxin FitB
MKLLDSNIIIYSYQPQFSYLKPLVLDAQNAVSAISQLEILGFHGISINEETYCGYVFKILQTFPIDNSVLTKAIELRKSYKMKLGDSIIAATALMTNSEIYTRNLDDFIKIPDLIVVNPIIE